MVLAMAGASRRHQELKSRLLTRTAVGLGIDAPCHLEDSDTRVVVERGGNLNGYYPDMMVIGGRALVHPRDEHKGVINPTLLLEVTSQNIERRDRGVKLDDYRLLPSLRAKLQVGVAIAVDDLYKEPLAES